MTQSTPWAILACEFSDGGGTPVGDLDYMRNLYTDAGVGTGNLVDFFDVMSHGAVDLRGSRVFGWLDLKRPRTDYIGDVPRDKTPAGKLSREGLIALAKSVAVENGIDLTPFFSVVVATSPAVDLCGYRVPLGVIAATNSTPQLIAQEMAHNYGLEHARSYQGVFESGEYGDPTDIMSGPNCRGTYARYGLTGPGLNAAAMHGRGWLDESRIRRIDKEAEQFPITIDLRPLHARQLPGYLAVAMDDVYFEFRDLDGFDEGLAFPSILVHYLSDNVSYIYNGYTSDYGLRVGGKFTRGGESVPELPRTTATVDAIDPVNRTATVTVDYRPGTGPDIARRIEVTRKPWVIELDRLRRGDFREPVDIGARGFETLVVPADVFGSGPR
jgi:hypothetical protein